MLNSEEEASETPPRRMTRQSTSPARSRAEDQTELAKDLSANSWVTQEDSQVALFGQSAGLAPGLDQSISQDLDIDWSSWLPSPNEDLDFNALQTLSGQMRGQERSTQPMLSNPLGLHNPLNGLLEGSDPHQLQRGPSPAGRTRRDIAKGMAMVTLEAAAEPHYVGESSGSFWSDIISRGMCEPSSANISSRRHNRRPRDRSPSPTDRHILRSSLQRQLSEEVAGHILLTVYQHLYSRVSAPLQEISQYPDWPVPFHRLGDFQPTLAGPRRSYAGHRHRPYAKRRGLYCCFLCAHGSGNRCSPLQER